MFYRLKENHPAQIAMNKAITLMEEVGISLEVIDHGLFLNHGGNQYKITDIEYDTHSNAMSQFPPEMEYFLTYKED